MGGRWAAICLVLAVLTSSARGEEKTEDRWSRPATVERRLGDWVPLPCPNCRPVSDQGAQASEGLPSVLTPPPRAEEARLLPPPPPPDGLFKTAATGFLSAFTQQQPPPRKHQQFLQETTQNRPQSQFLRSTNSQQIPQEPSQDFQPPQNPLANQRQPQLLQFNQQFQDQPYLNQPLLLGPQFLPAPFFPQTSLPLQNIQPIGHSQIQQQNPIQPNVVPVSVQNFQIPADRPVFTQQITANQDLPGLQQQVSRVTAAPATNVTESQGDDKEKDEVQLLYVPVETLNERARGKQKSLAPNQQSNRAEQNSPQVNEQNQFSTVAPQFERESLKVQSQTAKPQYNTKQNGQFQQQLPPEDQEKYNTQTHTVRQQFIPENVQNAQQQVESQDNFKFEAQSTKQQYNFKTNEPVQPKDPFQVDQVPQNQQFNSQQFVQFDQDPAFLRNPQLQPQNIRQQFNDNPNNNRFNQNFDQPGFNSPTFNFNQQFPNVPLDGRFQQQFPPTQQDTFRGQEQVDSRFNPAFQQQFQAALGHQQFLSHPDQPFLNQPIQFDQQVRPQQGRFQQQFAQQVIPQPQFDQPEFQQQTASPIAQTVTPSTFTSPVSETEKLPSSTRRPQPQQSSTVQPSNTASSSSFDAQSIDLNQRPRQKQQQLWEDDSSIAQREKVNQYDVKAVNQFTSGRQHVSSTLAPVSTVSSTFTPPRTTLAPNQPPLSVYMETTEDNKINDVLRLLKNAKSIQVLDTIGPESPQVFVGPSNLKPPSGYIKFELPYLNTLESNRVERKVDKLPFFVAPLNFNPPPGYSKIPFPAPHIGSVVVSNVTVLRTALHDKTFENVPVSISSTERYNDQYTVPAAISSISPQLPSLINSLKDEIYSPSSTPFFTPSSVEKTTEPYTTQTTRLRGTNRGSQRGSSNYAAPTTATRRPQTRTRRPYDGRPYSRRQPLTSTTTTTEEPTTEQQFQHYTSQPEQSSSPSFNSEAYSVHNTVAPVTKQLVENNQQNYQHGSTYYDEQFVANTFNQNQQQISQPLENQNVQQLAVTTAENGEHYSQNFPQNYHSAEPIAQTTSTPQQEEQVFKSQRASNTRKDPTRHHQRFRGRQRVTTTTTEVYEQPPPQPVESVTNQQTGVNYESTPSRPHLRNQDHHRLVENTHFHASTPEAKYNIQTERADTAFQTTERLTTLNDENKDYSHSIGSQNFGQQYFSQTAEPNHSVQQQQLQQSRAEFFQPNRNLDQSQFNGEFIPTFQQNPQIQYSVNQHDPKVQKSHFFNAQEPQGNTQNVNHQTFADQEQQNYFDQLSQQQSQESLKENQEQVSFHNQQQYSDQKLINDNQDHQTNHRVQPQHNSAPGQFEKVVGVTHGTSQEAHIKTTDTEYTISQETEEPQVQQYNQQRLSKYDKSSERSPVQFDSSSAEHQGRGHHHFQDDATTTEAATTKASLVRVRGRVRNRQRNGNGVRQTTTTEEPNYPASYLIKQRNTQENDDNPEYTTKKRINHGQRQAYTLSNRNKEHQSDQINTESYTNSEIQPSSESFVDNVELSTTTTEASTKPGKRYQHILNRNKARRTRPTDSPVNSRSSGTTRFLAPTTTPPMTRLPSTRGRIRKPLRTTTTTELPQANPSWTERDSFAPSAGSNEILEPLYQTRDKTQLSAGFQRTPVVQKAAAKTSPRPAVASSDDDENWNQGVTIQQSTSFDFKPQSVTPASFSVQNDGKFEGTYSPIWNGHIELQDGNYFDLYQKQLMKNSNDQTPFSTDEQKVVFKNIKNRRPIGKDNQYPEKEEEKIVETDKEDNISKVYPVYRESVRPLNIAQDDASLVYEDSFDARKTYIEEKDNTESSVKRVKNDPRDEAVNTEEEEIKEGALKRKIVSTNPEKKGGRRRGSWVRVRVRKPQDMFETAESQNLASLSENAIQGVSKTVGEKGAASSGAVSSGSAFSQAPELVELVTEPPTTTTSVESATEPAQTITFEQALKDMLKEFITNPEEENEEETGTEVYTDVESTEEERNTTQSTKEVDSGKVQVSEEEREITNEEEHVQDESKSHIDQSIKLEEEVVKTVLPEFTTEINTQEPTTIFQPEIETTVEPDVTTTPIEQGFKTPHSRVLGTSTTTEISLETEICYRGRCVKTKRLEKGDKADSDVDLMMAE